MAEKQEKNLIAEFAEFRGSVTSTLEMVREDVSEIKRDTKEHIKVHERLESRIVKLEENKRLRDKIGESWKQWVAIVVSLAAVIYSTLRR